MILPAWMSARCPIAGQTTPTYVVWELDVLDRDCAFCGRMMHICDHRYRRFFTLDRPGQTGLQAQPLPRSRLPRARQDQEPRDGGVDRAARVGHRLGRLLLDRPSALLATLVDPPDPAELLDSYAIKLSEPCIGLYIQRYQTMLACASRTSRPCAGNIKGSMTIILTIDGLQPEKGHETLYAVRELTQKRVWFAEALISATAEEVRRLIAQAKRWAETPGQARRPLDVGQAGRLRHGCTFRNLIAF